MIVLYVLITCNLLFNLEMELYKKQGRITCYRTFMSTITETDGFFRKFDFHLIRLSFFFDKLQFFPTLLVNFIFELFLSSFLIILFSCIIQL